MKKGWSFLGSAASVLLAMASTMTDPMDPVELKQSPLIVSV